MSNIEQIKEILKIKKDIYQSIVKKGSDINKTAPFKNYAQKISEIKTTSGKVDLGDLKITKFSPKPNDSEMTFTDNDGNELLNFGNMVITNQNEQINYTAKHVGMQDLSGSTIADTNKEIQVLLQRLGQGVKKIRLCGHYGTYLIMDNGDLYASGYYRLFGNPLETSVRTKFEKVAENVRDVCIGGLTSASYILPMYITENDELWISSTEYYSKSGNFEKVAENVKSIYGGYQNSFYITNNDILFGIGKDDNRLLGNNGNEATEFIELGTDVKEVRQFHNFATYYLTNDNQLYGTGIYANPSADTDSKVYLYAFQRITSCSDFDFMKIEYYYSSSSSYFTEFGLFFISYYFYEHFINKSAYTSFKENLGWKKLYLFEDPTQTSPSILVIDKNDYIYKCSSYKGAKFTNSKLLNSKIRKVKCVKENRAKYNNQICFILTEDNELYFYGYYDYIQENIAGSIAQGSSSQLILIAKDVVDFDANGESEWKMYNSGYVKTNGDCYLVGYNTMGNLGVGNNTSNINSYTRVSFAENNV